MSSVSVVTNALRLRGFRRPESAQAILHPPVGERVREYAYLAGIALVAIAIGAAALFFARPEHDMDLLGQEVGQEVGTAVTEAHDPRSHAGASDQAASRAGADPSQVQHLTIRLSEFSFAPASIGVKLNQPVRVTVQNDGQVAHDWVVQGLGQDVHLHAEPGQSASGQFTPTRAGTFKVVCTEPGHAQAGMVGELIVQP